MISATRCVKRLGRIQAIDRVALRRSGGTFQSPPDTNDIPLLFSKQLLGHHGYNQIEMAPNRGNGDKRKSSYPAQRRDEEAVGVVQRGQEGEAGAVGLRAEGAREESGREFAVSGKEAGDDIFVFPAAERTGGVNEPAAGAHAWRECIEQGELGVRGFFDVLGQGGPF